MVRQFFIVVLTGFFAFSAPPVFAARRTDNQTPSVSPLDVTHSERGQLFRDGNYAMFIHWGLYSQLAGQWKGKTYYGIGEWIKHTANIPSEEYMAVAKEFNPANFDANAIARLAKDAGMKYVVITSKHHDGFAMFDSAHPFSIVKATPFHRDPMKELAEACRQEGLGFGFYYSHWQDWTAPGAHRGPTQNPDGTPASFERYFREKCYPQVKEICTKYGPLEIIWFDTPGEFPKEKILELYNLVKETQPRAFVCSRIGQDMGDYMSNGDMDVPLRNMDGLWETCDTTNDTWGYTWYDKNWKGPKGILERLISTVARGGTYLLNVGPDENGRIPEMIERFLRQAGQWIQQHPDVIYSAGPSPWLHALPWGDVTTQGDSTMSLCIYEWPKDNRLYLPGFKSKILSAEMGTPERSIPLAIENRNDWICLKLPAESKQTPISVVKLNLADKAVVDATLAVVPNGKTDLLIEFSEVENVEKKRENWMEKFGEWKYALQAGKWTETGKAVWTVNVLEPGLYQTSLTYKGQGRLVWRIETEEKSIVQNQQAASSVYHQYPFGILEFKQPGRHTLTVSLVDGNTDKTSLESLHLCPVE